MKAKFLFAITVILVMASSCKKPKINPDGMDIDAAINSNVLFSTWIIDDDDATKQKTTENSSVFANKTKVKLTFNKDHTYLLKYVDPVNNKANSETGSWSTNSS